MNNEEGGNGGGNATGSLIVTNKALDSENNDSTRVHSTAAVKEDGSDEYNNVQTRTIKQQAGDKDKWKEAVRNEYEQMVKMKV